MPPEVSGAVAALITAISTVLLWWGSSKWGPGSYRDDEGERHRHRTHRPHVPDNDPEDPDEDPA